MEAIIADRVRKGKPQYLVKWLGRGPEENEWLNDSDLLHCQDAVKRYLDYSVSASQAAQRRKTARLEQQKVQAARNAEARRVAVQDHADGIEPMEVDSPIEPAATRRPTRKRKPAMKLMLCFM